MPGVRHLELGEFLAVRVDLRRRRRAAGCARSPGATARQERWAISARAMAASVSSADVPGTVVTGCSVAGFRIVYEVMPVFAMAVTAARSSAAVPSR